MALSTAASSGFFSTWPTGQGLPAGVVEIGGRHRVFGEVFLVGQQGVEPRADLEAAIGQRDGRLEQLRPGQLAMLAMRHLQHAHRARHAHRAAADHGIVEGIGLPSAPRKSFSSAAAGAVSRPSKASTLAPVVVQQEGAAADAAGLRLHQVSTICTAMAASTAEPPALSTW
jgi:hypothetical protein